MESKGRKREERSEERKEEKRKRGEGGRKGEQRRKKKSGRQGPIRPLQGRIELQAKRKGEEASKEGRR